MHQSGQVDSESTWNQQVSINFEVREVDAQAANDGHLCGLAPSDLHTRVNKFCNGGF